MTSLFCFIPHTFIHHLLFVIILFEVAACMYRSKFDKNNNHKLTRILFFLYYPLLFWTVNYLNHSSLFVFISQPHDQIFFRLECIFSFAQLQLSPARTAGMLERNGNIDECIDDEMEMTEFYSGAGSQSVDCEASPPALQVTINCFWKYFVKFFTILRHFVCRGEARNRISLSYQLTLVMDYGRETFNIIR